MKVILSFLFISQLIAGKALAQESPQTTPGGAHHHRHHHHHHRHHHRHPKT